MFPDKQPAEVAEELAVFFNEISNEYEPLDVSKIPTTYERQLPILSDEEVAERTKIVKKPTSTVPRDIPAALFTRFANLPVSPITTIFNKITCEKSWPTQWKTEYVTVIPKENDPEDPSQCRNISCTNFLSKLYESFVLEWSRQEVVPKTNQYGGE